MADYLNVITMTAPLEINGENNIYTFYLEYMHQYEFTDSEVRYRKADDVGGLLETGGDPRTHVLHYKITSTDGLDYCWVPSIYTAIENRLRTPEEQDRRLYNENIISDQPRDWRSVYKKITGIDMNEVNKDESHNGYELYKEYLRDRLKNNGKVYGTTIPKTQE